MNAFEEFYLNVELVETGKMKTAVILTAVRSGGISICASGGGL